MHTSSCWNDLTNSYRNDIRICIISILTIINEYASKQPYAISDR